LLHDAGKPATQEFIEDKIRFLGHEEVSGEIAEAVLRRLKFDTKTTQQVRFLVENHMRPTTAREWGAKAVRKFVREIGDHLEDLLDLHDADSAGSLTPEGLPAKTTGPVLREKIKQTQEIPVRVKPILDGNTVMRLLGVPSGPEVGKAMRWLQELVDDYAAEGKELTAEEAEELLVEEYR
jgi:poly(A) polymerase